MSHAKTCPELTDAISAKWKWQIGRTKQSCAFPLVELFSALICWVAKHSLQLSSVVCRLTALANCNTLFSHISTASLWEGTQLLWVTWDTQAREGSGQLLRSCHSPTSSRKGCLRCPRSSTHSVSTHKAPTVRCDTSELLPPQGTSHCCLAKSTNEIEQL